MRTRFSLPLPEGCVIAALALGLLFCACVVVPALALHSLARRVGDWERERIERDW